MAQPHPLEIRSKLQHCSPFLKRGVDAGTGDKQFCAIGSVKSNIGHTVAAAGVAGLIKTALSLYHQQIPPTLHYKQPNPQIDFESSPFFVCNKLMDWKRTDQPRLAGISSFGVGGTNAHVVLGEAPIGQVGDTPSRNQFDQSSSGSTHNSTTNDEISHYSNAPVVQVIPLSAKSEAALDDSIKNLALSLEQESNSLVNVAHTLQRGREDLPYRAFALGMHSTEACHALGSQKPHRFGRRKASPDGRPIVFMFPGQGAQYVRMGHNLYQQHAVFRRSMDRCCDLLEPLLEKDLRSILFPTSLSDQESLEILKNTRFTQPALFSLGYSLAQLWLDWGFKPNALMGHSIGEFAAGCVAGIFDLETAVQLIAKRGASMESLPRGSMMSVRLPGCEVEPMLWGDLAIGACNGPKLCVVAGPDDQVCELQQQLESKEIACRHLHTSHAFHSPMMDPIVEPFAEFTSQFQLNQPRIPILSTVTGDWLTDQQACDPRYWAEHLRQPVRFSDSVTRIWQEDPSRVLIELGPRKTLATLARQHLTDPKKQIAISTMGDTADDQAEWWTLMHAVGQLWLAGIEVDWERVCLKRGKVVSLPNYPFQRKTFFVEPKQVQHESSPASTHPNCLANNDQTNHSIVESNPVSSPKSTTASTQRIIMSRIPNIISKINQVFETTSGFDLEEFETDATFFEMGLDSLVLTQTATALKKEFGAEVTFRQLLEETPTTALLAEFLDECLPPEKFAPEPADQPAAQTPQVEGDTSTSDSISPTNAQTGLPTPIPVPEQTQTPQSAVVQPQAMVPLNPVSVAPMIPAASSNGAEAIIQNQLQLMAAQLQLLGGQPVQQATTNLSVQPGNSSPNTVNEPTTNAVAQQQVASEPASLNGAASSETTNRTKPPTPETSSSTNNSEAKANEEAPPKKAFGAAARVKLNDGELSDEQQAALDEIIRMHNAMTPKSKAYAQQHRRYMADPRTVSGFRPNLKEMTHPIVVDRSKGVYLWDIDGNQYIDYTCGFGSNFLGHGHEITIQAISQQVQEDFSIGPQTPLAGEVAKLFAELTGSERVAFSNTGSEAVLGATRLARTATGRNKIVMFHGDYHGILDEVIVRGNKKFKSFPAATGIPREHVDNTLILDYGTDESLEIIQQNLDDLAAILVEPVQSRRPELQPREFLQKLGRMTEKAETALIFDEVISGLRIAPGGAQEHFGVRADLASYGKVVGGGMPIGVIAGKAKYMDGLDGGFWEYGDDSRPEAGMTYFAGTFVRHPLTLAASKAILEHIKAGGQAMYDRVNDLADNMAQQLNELFQELDAPMYLANFGSLFKVQFHEELVYGELLFAALRRRGIHIWDHRPCLLTLAHRQEHIDQFVEAFRASIIEMQRWGFLPGKGYQNVSAEDQKLQPPQLGAKMGQDKNGEPGWFIPDAGNPGRFVQVGINA